MNHIEDNPFLNGICGGRICIRGKDMGCKEMIGMNRYDYSGDDV